MSLTFGTDIGGGMSIGMDGHLRTNLGGVSIDLNDGSVGIKVGSNMVIDSDGTTVMNSGSSSDRSSFERVGSSRVSAGKAPDAPKPWWKFW